MAGKEHNIDFIIRAATGSGFHGTFSKAQQEFTWLGKEIQKTQSVQRDVSAYQRQQAAVERTGAKLKNLQEQQAALRDELKAVSIAEDQDAAAVAALTREKLKLEQRIRETTNALETQNQRLNATGDRLKEAKVDTNDLSQADARLTEQLKDLRAEQDRAAEGAAEYGEAASTGFKTAGQALAAAGIVAGLKQIGGAYLECVQTAAGFGASMSNVGALSGASDGELALLAEKAKEMGAATKFTAQESADAFGYMALAGWDAQKQIVGIGPVLNLATAAKMDLAQASDIVTDYLTAFGLTADDAAAFTDKMAYAMSHSNTDVVQLGDLVKFDSALDAVKLTIGEQFTPELRGLTELGTDALTVLNKAMGENPAVTKAIMTFTGVMGLATAGVAADGAAVKAAQALELGKMFATAGPFLAAAGISAVAAAVVGLNEAYRDGAPEAWALKESVGELRDTLDESGEACEEAQNKALASAEVAGQYIDKLDALGDASGRSAEQNEEYQHTVAMLLQVMPELSGCFDETVDQYGRVTREANTTTQAMQNQVEAVKQAAIAASLEEQRAKVYDKYAEVLVGVEQSKIEKKLAEEARDEAQRRHDELVAQQAQMEAEAKRKADAANQREPGVHYAYQYLPTEEYEKLQAEILQTNADYQSAVSIINSNNRSLEDSAKATEEAEKQIGIMDEAVQNVAENAGIATDAVGALGGAMEGAAGSSEAFQSAMDEISAGADAVAQAYQEVYNEIQGAVSGQFSLWDEAEGTVAAKSGAIEQALSSQTQYWADYNANLENLEQRAAGIEGLSDILAELAGSGPNPENANYLAGLAKLSDEQLSEIVEANKKLKEEQGKTVDNLKELRTDLDGEMDEYSRLLAEKIEDMDQSDEARKAVENTIQGLHGFTEGHRQLRFWARGRGGEGAAGRRGGARHAERLRPAAPGLWN